jgi:hypothetical protein
MRKEDSMLQQWKVSSYVFILCLFGLTLTAASNVSAREGDSAEILECSKIPSKSRIQMKQKKDCFADVARALNAALTMQLGTYTLPYHTTRGIQRSTAADIFCNHPTVKSNFKDKTTNDLVLATCTHSYTLGWDGYVPSQPLASHPK